MDSSFSFSFLLLCGAFQKAANQATNPMHILYVGSKRNVHLLCCLLLSSAHAHSLYKRYSYFLEPRGETFFFSVTRHRSCFGYRGMREDRRKGEKKTKKKKSNQKLFLLPCTTPILLCFVQGFSGFFCSSLPLLLPPRRRALNFPLPLISFSSLPDSPSPTGLSFRDRACARAWSDLHIRIKVPSYILLPLMYHTVCSTNIPFGGGGDRRPTDGIKTPFI